ncbi:hypothetical protein ACWF94_25235 [Streptomyces sp. NPDC055078]
MIDRVLMELMMRSVREIHASLTTGQFARFRDAVRALRAAEGDSRAIRDGVREIRRRLEPLPKGSELSLSLHQFRSTTSPELLDAERLGELIRLLDSVEWPTLDPGSTAIDQAVRQRLLAAPARGADRLTGDAARDPAEAGLIRLTDPEHGDRYPDFQFDPGTGEPYPVVQRINRMLKSDQDPWGVADWWLSPDVWLREAPATAIGRVADGLLIEAAQALTGEGSW